ncbi:MAG TPA: EamA family transporter [Solirubrobacteraceae bacterium]|nr:EamA family transporter [Solirubrobacteraceae bacterium]
MVVLLAVAAAAGWGASDFFGGDASRQRTPVLVVIAVSEVLGLALLAPVLIGRGTLPPADPRLLLAAIAGVAVTAELSLIYLALSRGDAFITAPVGALGTATAVTIGLTRGNPVDPMIAAGLLIALLGGAISGWTSGTSSSRTTLAQTAVICIGAATAVGVMLTCFHAAGRLDAYWATAAEHASTALSAGLVALAVRRRSPHRMLPAVSQLPALGRVAAVGVGGDLAYAAASHHGALSIVSAVSSLYPVTTILLGRILQARHATRIQLVGIALALSGAALLGAAAG